jgi:multiple sugar transport system substrate-binding protein
MFLGAGWLMLWQPGAAIPPDRQGDVIVQYWEKWTGAEEAGMQQIVDDFNATVGKQKHIYVDMLSMSDIDQKTLVATAGGVPPDVAGLWDPTIVQLGSLGALEPLEDMAAQYGIKDGVYKSIYWRGCHYNGHLYALISTPAAVALFYNTRIFHENAAKLRAAGLDPDRSPQSIDELDRYADVLSTFRVDKDGQRHLQRAGYLPMEPGWYIVQTPLWFGADEWDPQTGKFDFTSPGVLNAYRWMQSYSLKYGKDAVTEFETATGAYYSAQNEFLSEQVVMEQQGPWVANFVDTFRPDMKHDWAAAPFPSAVGQKDVTYAPFDSLSIPVGAKHPKEAFEFIAFVNRQDEMEKLCMSHCVNSPLVKVSDHFLKNHPNPYISVFEQLASSPNAHLTMQCPLALEAGAELSAVAQGVVTLTLDPATALAAAQARMQAKYDDFAEKQRIRQQMQ